MPKVAVLIDFENVSNIQDVESVLQLAEERGDIIAKKAFGDWSGPIETSQLALTQLGVELVHQVGIGKGHNGSDMRLVIGAMDLLHDRDRRFDILILATSDVDFVPLVVRMRSEGKKVIGAGRLDVNSGLLKRCVDEYFGVGDSATSASTDLSGGPADSKQPKGQPAIPRTSAETPIRPEMPAEPINPGVLDNETRLLILKAFSDISTKNDGEANGASLGSRVKALNPDSDFRNLGFASFSGMLEHHPDLRVERSQLPSDITVTLKSKPSGASAPST